MIVSVPRPGAAEPAIATLVGRHLQRPVEQAGRLQHRLVEAGAGPWSPHLMCASRSATERPPTLATSRCGSESSQTAMPIRSHAMLFASGARHSHAGSLGSASAAGGGTTGDRATPALRCRDDADRDRHRRDQRGRDQQAAAPGAAPRLVEQRSQPVPPPATGRSAVPAVEHEASITSFMRPVNRSSAATVGLTDQAAAEIRRGSPTGRPPPGERLPPAKDIAAVLGVNRNTVLTALRMLRDEGLVDFRRGRGVVVAGTPARSEVVEHARSSGSPAAAATSATSSCRSSAA